MRGSSDVSWSGEMTWSYNVAGEDAGELGPGSTVPAYAGGAVYMYRCLNVSWAGETTLFHNNTTTALPGMEEQLS